MISIPTAVTTAFWLDSGGCWFGYNGGIYNEIGKFDALNIGNKNTFTTRKLRFNHEYKDTIISYQC